MNTTIEQEIATAVNNQYRRRPAKASKALKLVLLAVGAVIAVNALPNMPTPAPTAANTVEPDLTHLAVTLPYATLARDPSKHKNTIVVFKGKVVQAVESGQNVTLRVNVAYDNPRYQSDIIYVEYRRKHADEPRVLENDIVKFWGRFVGIRSYKAVLGQTIQIPHVVAQTVEVRGDN